MLGAVLAVLAAGTAVAIALANRSDQHTGARAASSPASRATSASSPDFPSSTPQTSSPQTSTQAAPSSTAAGLPSTRAAIDLSRVTRSPQLAAVATLLDTYFSGINAHDPVLATSVFAADGTVNPGDASQVAKFGNDTRTTHDDRIAVLGITPAAVPGGTGLLVRVSFRSTQAPSLGPGGQACTDWSLTYRLRSSGSGTYQLLGAQDVTYAACGSTPGPAGGLALFAGSWSGHTRSLTISAAGVAVEHVGDGCCDPQFDLTVQLTNPSGTTANATADARVTAVHIYPGFPASQPRPYVGQRGTFTLRNGILTDNLVGVFYCDAVQGAKGSCGA